MTKKREWSDEDIQYLRENYQTLSNNQIADHLSMSASQVKYKANKLELSKKKFLLYKRSKEIDEFIIKNHDKMSISELAKETGLSVSYINKIKKELGVSKEQIRRPWSAEEDEFIIKNHKSMNYRQISEAIGRSRNSVENRSVYLNLGPKHRVINGYRLWTPEEEKYLSDNFQKMSTEEIAENIDRTEEAIRTRVYMLSLCVDQDE